MMKRDRAINNVDSTGCGLVFPMGVVVRYHEDTDARDNNNNDGSQAFPQFN